MIGLGIQSNNYMVPWGADMFRGVPGSMNIQLNQALADLQARSTMWNVPTFGFDFNSYPNMPYTGIEGLLNPQYTWNQQMWNNAANGSLGMGCVGSGIGAFGRNFGNFGMSNPFTSPWNASTGDSSSTDPDTKKYNKLLNFLKKLNDYVQNDTSAHILTSAQKDRLDELAKHGSKEKDMKDKYNELKEFYDGLNSSDIQYFLEFGSTKLSINGKNNGATLYESLVNSGFEYSDTAIDKADLAGNVNAKLKAISKEDFNLASVLDDVKSYKALDFLSSYYSKYKAGSSDDIIDLFFKAVDKAPKDSRDCVKADFKVLITELINQSRKIATEIGGSTKEEINKIADKLDKAYSNFDKNKIKEYFRQLYTISRIAAAKNLENTLKETYGEIDPKLFSNNSFITKKTEEDLEKEGLSSEYNKLKNKVQVKSVDDSKGSKNTGSSSSTDWSHLDTLEDDSKIVNELKKTTFVEEDSKGKVTIEDKTYNVYKVKGKEVYFIVKDKEIVKVTKNGNTFTVENDATRFTPSEFADTYDTNTKGNDSGDDSKWSNGEAQKAIKSAHLKLDIGEDLDWEASKTQAIQSFNTSITGKLVESAKKMGIDKDVAEKAGKTLNNYFDAAMSALDEKFGEGMQSASLTGLFSWGWGDNHDAELQGDTFYFKNELTGKEETCTDQTTVKAKANYARVNEYKNINDGNTNSGTGIYIGCATTSKDTYYVYIDRNEMINKFKEFLGIN